MICFFTSSTMVPDTLNLNPANGFIHRLHLAVPYPCRALYVCSDPDDWEKTDLYAAGTAEAMERAGFAFTEFEVLDGRNAEDAAALIQSAQFIILAGGHVPTQNAFFQSIGLRQLLRRFDGVLMGISAGSMNSADTVYAHPELEGEAVDPDYERFLPGLGLTEVNIIPHYNTLSGETLDGLDLFDDIAIPDSNGNVFFVLPDGSYILSDDGRQTLYGEAYVIADGQMERLSEDGDELSLEDRAKT